MDGESNMSDVPNYGRMGSRSDVYFAAQEPNKCAGDLIERSQSFMNVLRSNAYLDKLQRMYRA